MIILKNGRIEEPDVRDKKVKMKLQDGLNLNKMNFYERLMVNKALGRGYFDNTVLT